MNVPASLGAVGYAAFALVQPIPLSEIVPFSMVVAAFETEAARLALPAAAAAAEPEPEPLLAVVDQPLAPPVSADIPEPVVSYVVGGYRPNAPVIPSWSEDHPASPEEPAYALEGSGPADGSRLGEVAELAEHTAASEPEQVPATVVPVPVAQIFAVGGYGRDGDSGESRARQVLNELSFLFDDA